VKLYNSLKHPWPANAALFMRVVKAMTDPAGLCCYGLVGLNEGFRHGKTPAGILLRSHQE